jgi:hypothetical protein
MEVENLKEAKMTASNPTVATTPSIFGKLLTKPLIIELGIWPKNPYKSTKESP